MQSGRQRRAQILERRRRLARIGQRESRKPWSGPDRVPRGTLPADQAKLAHDGTYGPRPRFYADRPFTCVDCGKDEVWTAADQKWWYEEAQGKIASRANRCRDCRRKRRLRCSQDRRAHVEGLLAKYGLEGAARRLRLTVEALEQMQGRWAR
jgi:Probable zinc-ribbon domain